MHMSWCSPNLPILLSPASPLKAGPITVEEASIIASVFCLGGACGALIFGLLIDRIGRKYSLMISGALQLMGWLLVSMGDSVLMLCIARWLGGIGSGGAYVVIPSFVAEISDTKYKMQ